MICNGIYDFYPTSFFCLLFPSLGEILFIQCFHVLYKKTASILFNLNLFSINHNCEPHNILIYFSSVSLNNTL